MSFYLSTDDGPGTQVATTTGWHDVGQWIESNDDAPQLMHLLHHGWNEPASDVRDELAATMKANPPTGSVKTTLDKLATLLLGIDDDAPLVISNGMTRDSDDGMGPTAFSLAADPEMSPAVTLDSRLPETHNELPVRYRWQRATVSGDYTHPTTGQPVRIDKPRVQRWANNVKLMLSRKIDVPVSTSHKGYKDPRNTLGNIYDARERDGELELLAGYYGDDSLAIAQRNKVSIGVEPYTDAFGNVYPETITHLAVTPVPVLPGLTGFVTLSREDDNERMNMDEDIETVEDPAEYVMLAHDDRGDGHFVTIDGHAVFIKGGGSDHHRSPEEFAKVTKSSKGYHIKHAESGEHVQDGNGKRATYPTRAKATEARDAIHKHIVMKAKKAGKTIRADVAAAHKINLSHNTEGVDMIDPALSARVTQHLGVAANLEDTNEVITQLLGKLDAAPVALSREDEKPDPRIAKLAYRAYASDVDALVSSGRYSVASKPLLLSLVEEAAGKPDVMLLSQDDARGLTPDRVLAVLKQLQPGKAPGELTGAQSYTLSRDVPDEVKTPDIDAEVKATLAQTSLGRRSLAAK